MKKKTELQPLIDAVDYFITCGVANHDIEEAYLRFETLEWIYDVLGLEDERFEDLRGELSFLGSARGSVPQGGTC